VSVNGEFDRLTSYEFQGVGKLQTHIRRRESHHSSFKIDFSELRENHFA